MSQKLALSFSHVHCFGMSSSFSGSFQQKWGSDINLFSKGGGET